MGTLFFYHLAFPEIHFSQFNPADHMTYQFVHRSFENVERLDTRQISGSGENSFGEES